MWVRIPPPARLDPVTGLSRRATLAVVVLVLVGIAVGGLATVGGTSEGCLDSEYQCARFEAGEPVVVGALFPEADEPARRAVELAVELHGELAGRPVEVLAFGDGCQAKPAAEAARLLATDAPDEPPVIGVVGATCTPTAVTAGQILGDSGITVLSPTGPDVPAPVGDLPFYLRLPPLDPQRTDAFETAYVHRYGDAPDEAVRAGVATEALLAAAAPLVAPGPEGELLIPRTHLRDALLRAGLLRG